MIHGQDVVERLNAYTIRSDEDSCWLFLGHPSQKYPQLSLGKGSRGTHVIAWEAANDQEVPDGMVIMHSCDTPRCVNPNHLSLGSYSDNTKDAVAKGRLVAKDFAYPDRHGEKCGLAKLTDEDVLDMRSWRREGATYDCIAWMYGVSKKTARLAILGETWSHLDEV